MANYRRRCFHSKEHAGGTEKYLTEKIVEEEGKENSEVEELVEDLLVDPLAVICHKIKNFNKRLINLHKVVG